MIANLVSVHVKPEYIEQFKEITTYNHNNTRKEPGNVRFDVLWNKDDPTRFTLYEVFADADAVAQGDHLAIARAFCDKVVPAMQALRTPVDAMEALMPSALWPVPTYGEMTYKQ